MLLVFAICLLILSFVFYKRWNSYISPAVIISFSWGLVFLGYEVIPHGMYDISAKTVFVLFLWITSSLIGACFFSSVKVSPSKSCDLYFNESIRSIYYWISVIGVFPLLYVAYKQGTTMDAGSFLFNLRMANTGIVETEFKYGIFQYVFAFAYISLLVEVYSSTGKNRRIVILLIINILLAIITMAKSSFFFLIIPLLCIRIFKSKISLAKLAPILGFIILFMSVIQLLRAGEDSENVIVSMLNVYIFGGIPALDQIVTADTHTQLWGDLTFRFFHTVKSILLGSDVNPRIFINDISIDGYVYVPYPTNVFTVIFPFWMDFGFWGVIIGGAVFGVFSGFLFKLANRQRAWSIIVYSYLTAVLILPFFGEYLVTNLSYTIQLVFLSYFANNFKYNFKWR